MIAAPFYNFKLLAKLSSIQSRFGACLHEVKTYQDMDYSVYMLAMVPCSIMVSYRCKERTGKEGVAKEELRRKNRRGHWLK
jgi:hypothetical protein